MKVLVTYNIPRESFARLGKEHTITMPEGEYFTTENKANILSPLIGMCVSFIYPLLPDIYRKQNKQYLYSIKIGRAHV